jgi:hypothetical protein
LLPVAVLHQTTALSLVVVVLEDIVLHIRQNYLVAVQPQKHH